MHARMQYVSLLTLSLTLFYKLRTLGKNLRKLQSASDLKSKQTIDNQHHEQIEVDWFVIISLRIHINRHYRLRISNHLRRLGSVTIWSLGTKRTLLFWKYAHYGNHKVTLYVLQLLISQASRSSIVSMMLLSNTASEASFHSVKWLFIRRKKDIVKVQHVLTMVNHGTFMNWRFKWLSFYL